MTSWMTLSCSGQKGLRVNAVCGNQSAVLEESDGPARENDLPQGHFAELQKTTPGKGHEDSRTNQKQDRPHTVDCDAENGRRGDGPLGDGHRVVLREVADVDLITHFIIPRRWWLHPAHPGRRCPLLATGQ